MTANKSNESITVTGVSVSAGVAIGPAFVIDQSSVPVPEYEIPTRKIGTELKRLHAAIAKTQKQLGLLKQKAKALPAGAEDMTLLLEAYLGMLSGSRLIRGVEDAIRKQRVNAEAAIQKQIAAIKAGFAAMNDAYLAARGDDINEVGVRLIRNLLQQQYNPFDGAPEGSIILAEEITPADTALMDPERISGFVTVLGGAEGHAAIMARALGLPAVSGIPLLTHTIDTGDQLIIDGRKGVIIVRPDAEALQYYRHEISRKQSEAKKLQSLRDKPAVTTDGTAIALHANIELPRDLDTALASGAEGIGLLRTEFLFMNRPDLPDEDEQYEVLRKLVHKLDGKMLTVRTLDVGGEKLAGALGDTTSASANPALGLRAIRYGLKEPKILETQLAAILRASLHGPLRILIPMVSSVSQLKQVREHLTQVERRLARRGIKIPSLPPVGAMIEIPAAALAADALAKAADFFAIGSNDLTQYTLAIDRDDERVAELYDPYHPAVLRLIQFTVAAAWRANTPVSLCGEIAGDRRATALLLGLGLRNLSMGALRLPAVKQEIRQLNIQQSIGVAETILGKNDESDIHALLKDDADTESAESPRLKPRKKS